MSDEAFARRFYADRAELSRSASPIRSQRDEFTGEELYTLEREAYFLPPLELNDRELAALQTSLYLLEGQFAYAEPLRLALQNLALGRPNPTGDASAGAVTLNLAGGGYSPEIAQRLAKLETAISKQRTIVFSYFAMSRGPRPRARSTRTASTSRSAVVPRRPRPRPRRHPRVPRLAHPRRHPLRDPPRARLPHSRGLRPRRLPRPRADWQLGERVGEAVLHVAPTAAWRVERLGRRGRIETRADRSAPLHHRLREPRAARAVDPRRERPGAAARPQRGGRRGRGGAECGCATRTWATRRRTPRRAACGGGGAPRPRGAPARWRRSGSPCSRRCWPTCWSAAAPSRAARCPLRAARALPAHPRGAAGADQPAQPGQLRRRLLRGVRGDRGDGVRVDKELYGEEFRRPARL